MSLPLPTPEGAAPSLPGVETATPIETPEAVTFGLTMQVGEQEFVVTLADTAAARALLERLPMTITMQELNGNEKFHYLSDDLPTAALRPERIEAGDLMLYGSNCLVVFYAGHTTSYSYTPLGRVDSTEGLSLALGRGNVEVTLEPL